MATSKAALLLLILVILSKQYVSAKSAKPDIKNMSPDERAKYMKARDQAMKKQFDDGKMTFASFGVEQIWRDLQKKFTAEPTKIEEIKKELFVIDEKESKARAVKQAQQEGKPFDEEEAQFLEKDFRDSLMGFAKKYQIQPPNKKKGGKQPQGDGVIKDPKLYGLWQKISNMEFSGAELSLLREEMEHYQGKMEEFKLLTSQNPVMQYFQTLDPKAFISSKTLLEDFPDLEEFGLSEEKLQKEKSRYMQLTNIVITGFDRMNLITDQTAEFKQPMVQRMWKFIQEENIKPTEEGEPEKFTPDELEGLKQELIHMENKMNERTKLDIDMAKLKKDVEKDPKKKPAKATINKVNEDQRSVSKEIADKFRSLRAKVGVPKSTSEL
jgi:hypothetical protein